MKEECCQNIDVEHVAKLARLSLTEEERSLFQQQLDDVIRFVREIQAVDVRNVDEVYGAPVQNVFRADEPRKGLDPEIVLANAPEHDGRQFLVPRIV